MDAPAWMLQLETGEIEQVADILRRCRRAARKVTVLGTASSESITLTTLTLARLMARQAKVVVVDLVASSPTMAAVSADPVAPGLAELMQGEASFSQIITKDRLSRAHLVSAGRPGFDRAHAPIAAVDARDRRAAAGLRPCAAGCRRGLRSAGRTADVAGAARSWCPKRRCRRTRATLMCDQLRAVGFSEVTMLSRPCEASDAVEPGPRFVAA